MGRGANKKTYIGVALGLALWLGSGCWVSAADSVGARHDRAWLGKDGVRAAWVGYKVCTDDLVEAMLNARVNTVVLKYGLHDLLDLQEARWNGAQIEVGLRAAHLEPLLANTQRAARAGLHVFWMANYELELMLPHLNRLGYQPANVEGPTRFIGPGIKKDVSPFDRTFWHGILGRHGELLAELSLEYPIEGTFFDAEHYAGGIMYLQGCGFDDATYEKYVNGRNLGDQTRSQPPGERYEYLKSTGRLFDYYNFLEEEAFQQGRILAQRWRAINPRFVAGFWPLLDSWFSRGMLRGLGGAVQSWGFSGVEYYHGADQSRGLMEYFTRRMPNTRYLAGFYPPFAYSEDQLEYHVAQAIAATGGYWMLSPQKQLLQPGYQKALWNAHRLGAAQTDPNLPPLKLTYRLVEGDGGDTELLVTALADELGAGKKLSLSLWTADGGAALCDGVTMRRAGPTRFECRIPLVRRLTANRHLDRGLRLGAQYSFGPRPLALMYEDVDHAKLTDGMAYGFFATTLAWEKPVDQAWVEFDFGRPFEIRRIQLAQPSKLEDRNGGPSKASIRFAVDRSKYSKPLDFESDFRLSGSEYVEQPTEGRRDKRHTRGWLTWTTGAISRRARWARIELERVQPNAVISLGEVVVWGRFRGEIVASVQLDGVRWPIESGEKFELK